jgi:dTDP-4-amino-4,6-dideoxygalactose transaminase
MITKEPYNKAGFQQNKLFTKTARNAFLHILRRLRNEGRTLLLPEYIGMNDYEGSGVFDVVRISRIPFSFYKLSNNLSPIVNEMALENTQKYCLLVIHYFGFPPDNFKELISFCKTNDITLIEDCAHTIGGKFENIPLGELGTYAIHSIHKILPTSEGGILVDNSSEESFKFTVEEEGVKQETLAMYALSDFDKINQKRRENYQIYLDLLKDDNLLTFLQPKLNEGIAPLNFPILIGNNKREKLYFQLMDNKILTSALYYKLIPEVSHDNFSNALNISKSILNLPVHQDTNADEITYICEITNKLISNL